MKRSLAVIVLVLGGALLATGCAKPVATVNNKKIERKTLDLRVREVTADLNRQRMVFSDLELRQKVLQQMIDESLVIDEAVKLNITVSDKELDSEMSAIRNSLGEEGYRKMLGESGLPEASFRLRTKEKMLVMKFVIGLVAASAVTDEELREQYQGSQRPFVKSAQVLMRLIEVPTEEKAKELAAQVRKKKTDFNVIAESAARSDPAIMTTGGWTNPDYFQPPISDAMKELKVGQFGGPYKGKKGYFLIKIDDRKKEEIASFDEVKESIRSSLLEQKRQVALSQWLAGAREKAVIRITSNGGGR